MCCDTGIRERVAMVEKKNNLSTIDQVKNLIKEAIENNFYGKLTIQFNNGEVVLIRKEETLKIDPFGLN